MKNKSKLMNKMNKIIYYKNNKQIKKIINNNMNNKI